jgi:mRNA interferase MazF
VSQTQTIPQRGEIWLVQFRPATGSELTNPHPALVLSRDDVGRLPLRVVVPITSFQPVFASFPWMVELHPDAANGLRNHSVADCFQPRSFDFSRFKTRWGTLNGAKVDECARTVAQVLGVVI